MAENERGTVYLLHFEPAYRHARHYCGWSFTPAIRYERHLNGNGSPLIAAAVAARCRIVVATQFDGTRTDERRLKRDGHMRRWCPICRAEAGRGPLPWAKPTGEAEALLLT